MNRHVNFRYGNGWLTAALIVFLLFCFIALLRGVDFPPVPSASEGIGTNNARLRPMRRSVNNSDADKFVEGLLPDFGYGCEVGANDGQEASNTILFERKGWIVLCIEPNPLLEKVGRRARGNWMAVACGEKRDMMDFVSAGEFPYVSSSGFHTGETGAFKSDGKHFTVPVVPLDECLEMAGFKRLDLLSVDVEGHEEDVLKGFTVERWKPKIIILEQYGTTKDYSQYLTNYTLLGKKLHDLVYQRNETVNR